jgi:hypothetical protein
MKRTLQAIGLLIPLLASPGVLRTAIAASGSQPDELVLQAMKATLQGTGARLGMGMVYGWDDVSTTISWRFKAKAGQAEIVIVQAAESVSAGHTYQVEVAGVTLPGTVKDTGGWHAFVEVPLGTVQFPKAGDYELIVRPIKKGARGVMNLSAVVLVGSAVEGIAPSSQVDSAHPDQPTLGRYFAKTRYEPAPLPKYATTRDRLPSPIYDENTNWVAMYWKCWELAFRNFHEPARGSGYVSQFIDAAFNQNIFQWDTCFLTMFCNYAHPLVPGIGSLDNFYRKQYPDGEIAREIDRTTGATFSQWRNHERKPLFTRWGWNGSPGDVVYRGRSAPAQPPFLTLDALNHPIFSWAEREHSRITGDDRRIALVYEPLVRYYGALQEYLRQGNGLYMTDWASMDNSPRNAHLAKGGCAVDTSSQMVLFAHDLAEFAGILGKTAEAAQFRREAAETAAQVNQLMWDPGRKFYFDLTWEGARVPVKTIAGFWPLIAGIPSKEQADALAAELQNTNTFHRLHRVPTLAADQRGYDPRGGYWCGAVWAPTDTMIIRGLERCGHTQLARDIALNHLSCMGEVFKRTGTVWENYAPDSLAPGKPAMQDFVGWTGLGPIVYLLEFAIGLKPDAQANALTWNLTSSTRVGCERYRFNGHVTDLLATPDGNRWNIRVRSDGEFTLKIISRMGEATVPVKQGENRFVSPLR